MLPSVFPVLNVPGIQSYVGALDPRIYDFGSAPQDVTKPYMTFRNVADAPYEQVSGAPCGDFDSVQIDIYAGPDDSERSTVRGLARAVREALDDAGIANRLIIQMREADTKLFRISIEADFITNR
ncbi:hypothetical protein W822_20010 [Advenella kashmirensis W13003]|uniref:DUF3168 domain-containing protein n=1 Tax=Advenella kashmirensis W13003 TaxID=1424334 RepID=V8QM04_9BURK|nr:DUF3168 domain-containing protein [Advenella kashmirensis]ETF00682.1 hypothetical protein W822_20010 [Advenella kashmirensis W13003]